MSADSGTESDLHRRRGDRPRHRRSSRRASSS